jgi:hypothetical protein
VQVSIGAPSSEQANVEPSSVAVNMSLADVPLVGEAGPSVMVVSGAVVSTVQEWVAGVGSAFPAGSVARTSKVWDPGLRSA